ncbi:MAG: transcription elongation factor Spt5 [Candidatus Micrarchaeia archaeon]
MFFVVKVTSGQEKIVASILENKAANGNFEVYSITVIDGLHGYIILECQDEAVCKTFISQEKNIKGILSKPLSEEELDKMVAPKALKQQISIGDIIEFTAGPFKGYKARVIKLDDLKSEITVELMDVVVPIPITAKANTARVIQKAKES